jgi:hypothetical protein
MPREQIPVTPSVITWARDRAGFSVAEARRDFRSIETWERRDASPTYPQLEQLADPFDGHVFTTPATCFCCGSGARNLTIRHLVMPNHVECCTYPVLDWIAAHMPELPVNVMDQYRPDNFCDPHGAKYRPQYAEIARRPKSSEIRDAYGYAARLGLNYEPVTFDRYASERQPLMRGI